MKVYQKLAGLVAAVANTINIGNVEWQQRHSEAIDSIMKTAPSGGGIDCGTRFDLDAHLSEFEPIKPSDTLKFFVNYHHINEHGFYDGWTQHTITVYPSLLYGFTLTISGKDRNYIKEYLYVTYDYWLNSEWKVDK